MAPLPSRLHHLVGPWKQYDFNDNRVEYSALSGHICCIAKCIPYCKCSWVLHWSLFWAMLKPFWEVRGDKGKLHVTLIICILFLLKLPSEMNNCTDRSARETIEEKCKYTRIAFIGTQQQRYRQLSGYGQWLKDDQSGRRTMSRSYDVIAWHLGREIAFQPATELSSLYTCEMSV